MKLGDLRNFIGWIERKVKRGADSSKAPNQTKTSKRAALRVPLPSSWCIGYTITLYLSRAMAVILIVDTNTEVACKPAPSLQGIRPEVAKVQVGVLGSLGSAYCASLIICLQRLSSRYSPSCHNLNDISMNENGIVNTQRSRSEPARLTINIFLGDKTRGLRMTLSEPMGLPNREERERERKLKLI